VLSIKSRALGGSFDILLKKVFPGSGSVATAAANPSTIPPTKNMNRIISIQ
jgi:hypothetical protein